MEHHLRLAAIITNLLDNQFSLFGYRFGLNGVLGLIPGAGDFIVAVLSFYLVWIGVQMKIPPIKLVQMVFNVAFNFFLGLIPVIGDAADFFHKANTKNLAILKRYAKKDVIEGEIVEGTRSVKPL